MYSTAKRLMTYHFTNHRRTFRPVELRGHSEYARLNGKHLLRTANAHYILTLYIVSYYRYWTTTDSKSLEVGLGHTQGAPPAP
jgi:hypothetical protein